MIKSNLLNRKLIFSAIAYWIVVSAIAILVYPILMSDTMNRYAPMADAFAAGDWFHAFHPRFGVLFSILTGVFASLGFRGDQACQIVGIGFLAASSIPAWYLMRRVFDDRVAWFTAALVLLMPEWFVFAIDGLRDCARTFAVLMVAYTFVTNKRPWIMAIGLFVMATLRVDTQLVGGIAFLVWMINCLFKRRYRMILLPLFAYTLGIVFCSVMVYGFTGWFLPNAPAVMFVGGVK